MMSFCVLFQNTIPMRHKEIHAVRVHPSVKFAADFALGMVTEKLKKRIKFYTTLDAAKSIDRALLPKEYGGTVPMAKMIGKHFIFKEIVYFLH